MRRRYGIFLVLPLLLGPPAAQAPQAARPWRLGYLSAGSLSAGAGPAPFEAFQTALRELGYVDGQNLLVDARYAEGKIEQLPPLALELVKRGPDVILAPGAAEVQAVKRATTAIPIVMVTVPDPVDIGFAKSLARPGGNVTGLTSTAGPELHGKRLQMLRELAPRASRIALLVNPVGPGTPGRVQATEAAGRVLGVHVRVVEVRAADELNNAFSTMKQYRTEAFLVDSNRMFAAVRIRLAELAAQARMPVMYDVREYVEAGGLAAYGPSYADLFRRAAGYVDRILKGQKPADLAVEQPTKFELILNRKTANALGLALSPSLLMRADQVIE
jgi:putative ABC transport system substrate-binding protein